MVIPRLFSIPARMPFLPALLDALTMGNAIPGLDARNLSQATIYLPTRRAARALALHLAEQAKGQAVLLPKIIALGEKEEIAFDLMEENSEESMKLPPSLPPLERKLVLTRLVQSFAARLERERLALPEDMPVLIPGSPADAILLAGDLEKLMDSLNVEGIPWDDLSKAVEAEYSDYFALTLKFVQIAAKSWPEILAEREASDPADRQRRLLMAQTHLLQQESAHPSMQKRFFIAAGSTGSIPATASLLAMIAHMPSGAVFLPGLDPFLDEESWSLLGGDEEALSSIQSHPQRALYHLLTHHMKATRDQVRHLVTPCDRERLLSEALRPAQTSDQWAFIAPEQRFAIAAEGLADIAIVEADDERREALAIALAMRETLEEPDRTAALITPDRSLAKRVAAELKRWNIDVEDSSGTALSQTPAGALARLSIEALIHDFAPAPLMALLKHPHMQLGLNGEDYEKGVQVLEIGVLRGVSPSLGLKGLRQAYHVQRGSRSSHDPLPKKRLTQEDWDLAEKVIKGLETAYAPFTTGLDPHSVDLLSLMVPHRELLQKLRSTSHPTHDQGEEIIEDDFETLEALFEEASRLPSVNIKGRLEDYPAFFNALACEKMVYSSTGRTHRRLKILGPLEARLLYVDRVILGGLDEGIWPPQCKTDSFLSRPMRSRVGLTAPERRIGQSAHDFVQALGIRDVVITRAVKRGGKPLVPSRFLQRLKAFSGDELWGEAIERGARFLAYAVMLDQPNVENNTSSRRPCPVVPSRLIPDHMSISDVSTLVRDPYEFYARRILKLEPLQPLGEEPGAAERGTLFHDALGAFTQQNPTILPNRPGENLLESGRAIFSDIHQAFPEIHALWWPRFENLVPAFIAWEKKRRPGLKQVHAEVSGRLVLPLKHGGTLTLRARADRIEEGHEGWSIIDFKTGQPPSVPDVANGLYPQLTLEAFMLQQGAFSGLPAIQDVPALAYVKISGSHEPLVHKAVEVTRDTTGTVADWISEHPMRLVAMMDAYHAGERGFLSQKPQKSGKTYRAYDHLARLREWSLAGDDEEESA
jgi:ATP-dependent helicase/nuclease subunit B